MKQITIAFDIDGTILNNEGAVRDGGVNLPIINLMQILSQCMKNTRIIVWSGGGKDYAEQIVRKYGLEKYVDRVYDKHKFDESDGHVDIAFDDIHEFALGDKNLIVRMK